MPNKICYCEKCNKTMDEKQFYNSNNLEKYPNGKLNQCKKCISMHVDNWNPDSYLWILQECDVPYIPDEWNKLLSTYGKDKSKLTGLTILGRYLSKMRLRQFKDYRWKDTEFLQEMANNRIETTMKRQGYDAQEIATAINKATFEIPKEPLTEPGVAVPDDANIATGQEDYFAEQSVAANDDFDLTDEDRTYLRLKWGKTYRPDEWVQLEKLYNDMMQSYDIQTAGHIDTLKLICKTSLKANQLIDIGDVEGFQKMSKVYDSLMKSGKFTAAQNKAEQGEFVDAIGELVVICEKEGFIPRYYIGEPNDKVDETIKDMQRYTSTLVKEETNLSQLLEDAIKTVQKEDSEEREHENDNDEIETEDNDVQEVEQEILEDNSMLEDDDYDDFNEFLESQELADELLTQSLTKERKI